MANSVDGANSVAAGEKKEDLVLPVFAEDLAPIVRAGFDSMCAYSLESRRTDGADCIASYPD